MQDFFQHLKKQKREEPVDKWNMAHGAQAKEREGNTWILAALSNTRNTCFVRSEETASTDLQHSFGIRKDGGYKQHFRKRHCLRWLILTSKLWADIPHIITYNPSKPIQQTAAALPDIHRYTLCFMDTMVRGAKERNYGWNNITYTLRVYPVRVNWVYNMSHLWRLHPASEGGKFWRFTTLASLIMVIFFSGSDLIEFKINSSYDRQTWSLLHVTVCIDLYSLRRNWILCLNLRGNLLSVSLMALFHSLSLNICESGFDFRLAYVSSNQELLQRSC